MDEVAQVWAAYCAACNSWLPEWNREREEAVQILREHEAEVHA